MGLGWATESAAGGGMDAVGKLIEQRMQMARDAETVRSNMAREKQAADALSENIALRTATFGAAQADRDATVVDRQVDMAPRDTPIGPADQTRWNKTGNGGYLRTRPLDATALPAASVPSMTGGMSTTGGQTAEVPGGPAVTGTAPAVQVPDTPVPGKPGDMLSVPTFKNQLAEQELQRKGDASQDAIAARTDAAAQRQSDQQENIRLAASLRNPPQADRSRLDHSYSEQTKRLDAIEKPLSDQADRIARLRQTIDQNSPQADTLIAPELLIAMAGGAGTGLRINEAEIERVVGGKNQWEKLRSALGAWQQDTTKPFAVTPEQRVQMRALIKVVGERGQQRLKLIDDTRGQLLDATDVTGHRRALDHLKKALNDESAGGGGNVSMTSPDGRPLSVPAAKVAELEAAGAVRVQQ